MPSARYAVAFLGWRCKQTPLLLQGRHTPHLVWRLVLWPRSGQSAWYRSWYRSWYRDEASLFVVFPGRSFDLTNPNSRLLDFWSMAGLVRAGRRPGIYGVLVGGWARQSRPSTRRLPHCSCPFSLQRLHFVYSSVHLRQETFVGERALSILKQFEREANTF